MENQKTKPTISPSQVASYTRCAEAYRRRYIEKEIIPPGVSLVRGISVHKGAEVNFRQKIDTKIDLPKKHVIEAAVSTFDEMVKHEGVYLDQEEQSRGQTVVVDEAKDSTARLAELLMDKVVQKYQPTEVEKKITVELPSSSHDLNGIIDLRIDSGNILDFKTSKRTWSPDKVEKNAQFTFYAMMEHSLTGKPPKPIILENLVDLKSPKSVTFFTDRSMDDFKPLIQRINAVLDGVAKGSFPPAPADSWVCTPKFCGYYSTCRFVNDKRSYL